MGIAYFLIRKLESFFLSFDGRDLNAYMPSLDMHRRTLRVFEPIRRNLMGRTQLRAGATPQEWEAFAGAVLGQDRVHAAGPAGRKAMASISIFAFSNRPATCTAVLVGGSFGKNSPRMRENTA
jgi:hypothetical protein